MGRIQDTWWPDVKNLESARKASRIGFQAAAIIAGLSGLIGFLALAGVSLGGYTALSLVDASLFAIVAWRIYLFSRAWAVAGLLLMVVESVDKLSNKPSTFGVITVILILGFINGVRGTFAYQRHMRVPTNTSTQAT